MKLLSCVIYAGLFVCWRPCSEDTALGMLVGLLFFRKAMVSETACGSVYLFKAILSKTTYVSDVSGSVCFQEAMISKTALLGDASGTVCFLLAVLFSNPGVTLVVRVFVTEDHVQ
mgnify:CR=1 FL=1